MLEAEDHLRAPVLLCMLLHSVMKEDGQTPGWIGMVFLCAVKDHGVIGGHWR